VPDAYVTHAYVSWLQGVWCERTRATHLDNLFEFHNCDVSLARKRTCPALHGWLHTAREVLLSLVLISCLLASLYLIPVSHASCYQLGHSCF
jgi:hypothetical protein